MTWTPLSVGCHWVLSSHPNACVSTLQGPVRADGTRFSGYCAYVDRQCVGTFATREVAQLYVEALVAR